MQKQILREVKCPIVDNFTDGHLTVLAGEAGAGGASHYYEVRDRFDNVLLQVNLQHGPVDDVGVNGIGNGTLLLIALDFLQTCQAGEYRCRETALTITKLEEALLWTKAREFERRSRGVLGTHKQ